MFMLAKQHPYRTINQLQQILGSLGSTWTCFKTGRCDAFASHPLAIMP